MEHISGFPNLGDYAGIMVWAGEANSCLRPSFHIYHSLRSPAIPRAHGYPWSVPNGMKERRAHVWSRSEITTHWRCGSIWRNFCTLRSSQVSPRSNLIFSSGDDRWKTDDAAFPLPQIESWWIVHRSRPLCQSGGTWTISYFIRPRHTQYGYIF